MADKTIGGGLSAATTYNDWENRGEANISTTESGTFLRIFKPPPAACTNTQMHKRPRSGRVPGNSSLGWNCR